MMNRFQSAFNARRHRVAKAIAPAPPAPPVVGVGGIMRDPAMRARLLARQAKKS